MINVVGNNRKPQAQNSAQWGKATDQTTEISAPPTATQMKEVDEAFALFDNRKAGALDLYEVKVLMRSLGFMVRRKEVPLIVHQANPDSDGSVDLKTFRRIMESKFTKLEPGRRLRETFRLFDTGGRGKITIDDLRRASKDLNGKASERELEAVIDAFDRNLDGSISQEEFMSSIREQRHADAQRSMVLMNTT